MKIELRNITKSFEIDKKSKKQKEILKDISCVFEGSKLYFLTGVSGSGKSTLLSILGLLDSPTGGEILFDDQIIKNKTNFISSKISFVFQEYNLFENLTVYENLSLYQKDKEVLKKLLEQFNCEISLNTKVKYLSGGERQRLAILRSYIKSGEVFLMDEPTGNLDKDNSKMVMELIKSISKEKLVIVVSHDLELAYEYADEIYDIDDGKLTKKEQVGISYTLNLKEEGKSAFNPLIEKLFSLGELHLIIDGKEVTWTKNNYQDEIQYLVNSKDKILIKLKERKTEKTKFITSDRQNNKRSFLLYYSLRNILSRVGRTVASFIALIFAFALIFNAFNFTFYNVGLHVQEEINAERLHYSFLYFKCNNANYYEGVELHQVAEYDKENYYPHVDSTMIAPEPGSGYNTYFIRLLAVQSDTIIYEGKEYQVPENEILTFDFLRYAASQYGLTSLEVNDVFGGSHDVPIASETIKPIETVISSDSNSYIGFISYDYYFSLCDLNSVMEVHALQKIGDAPATQFQKYTSFNGQNLIFGRQIANDDEIVVSQSFIANYLDGVSPSEAVGLTFEIPDFDTYLPENRNNTEICYQDLSSFWEEVTIVGVTDDNSSEIYVTGDIFDQLLKQTVYRSIVYIYVEDVPDKINYLFSHGVRVQTTGHIVYTFSDVFSGGTGAFISIIGLVFLLIAGIVLLLWIISVLKDKYREIAIMKCLAIDNKHIYASFLITIILLTFVSIFIGVMCGMTLTPVLNQIVVGALVRNPIAFTIVSWNVYSFLLPFLFTFIFPPLVSLTFIGRINKVAPYNALKEFR